MIKNKKNLKMSKIGHLFFLLILLSSLCHKKYNLIVEGASTFYVDLPNENENIELIPPASGRNGLRRRNAFRQQQQQNPLIWRPDPTQIPWAHYSSSQPTFAVYLNRYHPKSFLPKYNKILGRVAPIYHSGVEIKSSTTGRGQEYSLEVNRDNNVAHINRLPHGKTFIQRGNFYPHKRRLMGVTKLHPDQIDEFVRGLNRDRFGGEKYRQFGNNCNNCAKAILKYTLSPENAEFTTKQRWKSRYNRLGNQLRRLPRFMKNRLSGK